MVGGVLLVQGLRPLVAALSLQVFLAHIPQRPHHGAAHNLASVARQQTQYHHAVAADQLVDEAVEQHAVFRRLDEDPMSIEHALKKLSAESANGAGHEPVDEVQNGDDRDN